MSVITHHKIAIIGAGPGGLTLARLLQKQGVNVSVYERDQHQEARPKGATLDLHEESGLKALQEAGLMKAFWASYRPGADKLRVTDQHARIIFDDDDHPAADNQRPEIDRGPLQAILLNALLPGTVVWDSQFASLQPQGTGWQIQFKNNHTAYADVVIAADGANSKLRAYITPIKPFYTSVTVVEGAVYQSATACPQVHQLLNGGKIFAMSDEKTLVVSSKGDGSLVFYTGCKTSEYWSRESGIDFSDKVQVLNWFRQEYAGWSDLWLELFINASSSFIPRVQYCMPPNQTWDALPNLTLLGDAAHLMPPYTGEGVNLAMLDALELSQCLTGPAFTNTHAAIAAYEQQMRLRASAAATETLEATAALHSPNAISYLLNIIS